MVVLLLAFDYFQIVAMHPSVAAVAVISIVVARVAGERLLFVLRSHHERQFLTLQEMQRVMRLFGETFALGASVAQTMLRHGQVRCLHILDE